MWVEKTYGIKTKELAELPVLNPNEWPLWHHFQRMSSMRMNNGFSVSPLTVRDFLDYFELMRFTDSAYREFLFDVLHQVDCAWLHAVTAKDTDEDDKDKPDADPKSSSRRNTSSERS